MANINDAATANMLTSLHLSAGLEHVVQDTIVMQSGLVSLFGEGRTVTKVYQADAMTDNVLVTDGGHTISDISFSCRNGGSAIYSSDLQNDNIIDRCWFIGNHSDSYMVDVNFANFTLSNSVFEVGGNALALHCGLVTMSDIIFYDIRRHVLMCINCNNINISNILIELRLVDADHIAAFEFYNCSGINLQNISFFRVFDGINYFNGAMYFEDCIDIQFNNVTIRDFVEDPNDAITFTNCTGINGSALIDGNKVVW